MKFVIEDGAKYGVKSDAAGDPEAVPITLLPDVSAAKVASFRVFNKSCVPEIALSGGF